MTPNEFSKLTESAERVLRAGESPTDIWGTERYKLLGQDFDRFIQDDPRAFEKLSVILGHDPEEWVEDEDEDEGGDNLDPDSLREDPGWAWDCVRDLFRDREYDADAKALLLAFGWTVESF